MAYFLKKTNNKKGIYLQIYESYYDPERKGGAHRSYKPIGYVHELVDSGIDDPISHFQSEVDELNRQHNEKKEAEKIKTISDESPEKFLGYFPLKNINDSLRAKQYIDIMQTATDFRFNVYDMMSSLVYSRAIHPCSKSKTYDEVLPKLFEPTDFSLDQLYTGLEYLGLEYEKVIEIYNHQINLKYKFNTSHTYFDCTNFYFEIDREDDFRRKGPSKENRHEPLVGLGLLLDANQIPIGMKLYPGNESEKPVMRDVIDSLKSRNNISGRTIQVADKGLNCGNNIMHALKEKDGYIFSKSVKTLSEKEKVWVLLPNDYREIKNSNGDVMYKIKECIDDFEYEIDDEKTNARFLLNYGFCLEDNDTSEFAMTIAFNESYPLFEQKKNFFQNECELVRTFNLNNNFYESQIIELLSFLRFILFEGDMEELYNAISSSENIYNEEIPLTFYYIHPISKELEIKVLKHLSLLCRRALGKYPTTFEEDQNLLKSKKNISFNLRNSLLLLMSEKTVLSYFIYFCEYCLELLKLKTQMEVLTKLSTDYKYNDCQFDFYIQEIVLQLVNDE